MQVLERGYDRVLRPHAEQNGCPLTRAFRAFSIGDETDFFTGKYCPVEFYILFQRLSTLVVFLDGGKRLWFQRKQESSRRSGKVIDPVVSAKMRKQSAVQ
jgi:hypothetical protein